MRFHNHDHGNAIVMNKHRCFAVMPVTSQCGFTLVELMIAMVLGLMVIAGVGSIYLANRQIYQTSQHLSEYQENLRYVFELLTKDIRQADGTACRKRQAYRYEPQSLIPKKSEYGGGYVQWDFGIEGFAGDRASVDRDFGTSAAARLAGTDALRVTSAGGTVYGDNEYTQANQTLTLPSVPSGSLFILCNLETAGLFADADAVDNLTVTFPANWSGTFRDNNNGSSRISGFSQVIWYLGCNDLAACDTADGRSLYRGKNNLAVGGDTPNPVINGVRDLQFEYLARGAIDYADTVASWNDVIAVRITVEMFPPDVGRMPGSVPDPLAPRLTHVIALRNRIKSQ